MGNNESTTIAVDGVLDIESALATQFFEGLFDVRLAPGETFRYTFAAMGEYFFNDPFSARPTGKIEVY